MKLTRRGALGVIGGTLAAPYARPSWAAAILGGGLDRKCL